MVDSNNTEKNTEKKPVICWQSPGCIHYCGLVATVEDGFRQWLALITSEKTNIGSEIAGYRVMYLSIIIRLPIALVILIVRSKKLYVKPQEPINADERT